MINLSKSGDTIVFEFINNGHYLENGTIEVPVNSLSLVTDSSNMATFYKADSGDIFISATYDELGKTKAEMLEWFEENMVGGGGIDSGAVQTQIDQSISGFADNASYDSVSQEIKFYNGNTEVYSVDASDFVIDGMIDDVRIETISGVSYLVIDFNTASGKEDIQIPLTDIFDPSNYYTKTEVDGIVSGKTSVVNLTQAEYDALVTGGTVDPTVLYNITDATPIDMSQYWTSAETNSAITQAVSGKQDTLSAGTNITIVDNVISAEGGGKAVSGGTNISITTGETADTINCTLPITINSNKTTILPNNASNIDNGSYGFVGGSNCQITNYASGSYPDYAFCYGYYNTVTTEAETAFGKFNQTKNASGAQGISGTSIFTIGNGNWTSRRHNALEVMMNGDIYIADTNDTSTSNYWQKPMIKLQDNLGSAIEVSSAITSGDTNPVQGGVLYDKFDEVEQVTAAALNNLSDNLNSLSANFDGLKLKKLTQAQYDALSPNYDNNTLYVII